MKTQFLIFGLAGSACAGDFSAKAIVEPEIVEEGPSIFEGFVNGTQRLDLSSEALLASDIEVFSTLLAYENTWGPWTLGATIGYNDYTVDYNDDIFTNNQRRLEEETISGSFSLARQWSDHWRTELNASAYNGFAEYRSIWIAEFYRFDFSGVPAYRDPDPHGFGYGGSVTWDYQPGVGSVTASLNYGRDTVAPGYGFDETVFRIVPTNDVLDTVSGSLRLEQALNGWLKTDLTLSVRETTDRDPRYGVENGWAAAFGPVAARITLGYSEEAPGFESLYGGLLMEWSFRPQWYLLGGARWYSDTGEIETSGFNTAAPGLDSSELYIGLLWDRGDFALNAGLGFLDSDYDALDADNQFLTNLYRDRDWYTVRLAGSYRF